MNRYVFFLLPTLCLWCFQLHLHPLCVTHTPSNTHSSSGSFFHSRARQPLARCPRCPFFMSVFSLQKASLLGFSHMNKQAFQSLPLNILISLASFFFLSLGSALDETVVYVYVFCVYVSVWMCAERVLTDQMFYFLQLLRFFGRLFSCFTCCNFGIVRGSIPL